MDRAKFYKNMNRDEFKVLDVWRMKKSPVALFIEDIEDAFGIVIHFQSGDIVKFDKEDSPHLTPVILRFVLNNQILDVERVHYDDKQMVLRLVDQTLRRVSMKVMKEVYLDGQVFKVDKNKYL
ncbi:hypothetical protein ACLF6N_22050 (plasmid) [Bacillus subtilis]|uniref:hypothetical protein n=1 Tax=Bacillus subtilis TaxID=1423 RepID=UPI00399032BB